jgi:hypothetical protein
MPPASASALKYQCQPTRPPLHAGCPASPVRDHTTLWSHRYVASGPDAVDAHLAEATRRWLVRPTIRPTAITQDRGGAQGRSERQRPVRTRRMPRPPQMCSVVHSDSLCRTDGMDGLFILETGERWPRPAPKCFGESERPRALARGHQPAKQLPEVSSWASAPLGPTITDKTGEDRAHRNKSGLSPCALCEDDVFIAVV